MKTTTRATGVGAVALAAILGALTACEGVAPQINTVPVEKVAYRPDGSLVLFTAAGIYVYDGRLVTEMNHIPLDALVFPPLIRDPSTGEHFGFLRYDLSADGTTAAVSSNLPVTSGANARVAIYRIRDGELLSTFEVADGVGAGIGVMDLALSPDGTLLGALLGTGTPNMIMFDAATGAPLWTDDVPRTLPTVWSPDGTTVFAKGDSNVLGVDRTLNALDARTGTLKWQTTLSGTDLLGLAVVGDGVLLATASYVRDDPWPDNAPRYPFWSAVDGTLAVELPGVPHTWLYAASPTGNSAFTCNATDTCAAGIRDYTRPDQPQPKYVRVFQSDGTVLQTLQTEGEGATPSIAISPDGNFLTTAAEPGVNRGATVFAIADGSVVGAHTFPTEAF